MPTTHHTAMGFAGATPRPQPTRAPRWRTEGSVGLALALTCAVVAASAQAQTSPYPITSEQRRTATQVAQAGVPLSELAPNAPERHTVRPGDTLWDISALFLQRPWRWPELWGMNLEQIRNPHLIFPGQVLVLTRVGDRAMLSVASQDPPTVRLSPRIRAQALSDAAIAPIPLHVIQPFLNDALVIGAGEHDRAPRIVAAHGSRTLLSRGDVAYARGQFGPATALEGSALGLTPGQPLRHRIYRNATALVDPITAEVLGYEAQFIGQSELLRAERSVTVQGQAQLEPATIQITLSNEEIRLGDRLLPEPAQELPIFVPRPPATAQSGHIVRVHDPKARMAGQFQIVILNRGARDGLERGHVLSVLRSGPTVIDRTDTARPSLSLPAETSGLMMVFSTFDRVSYALILQATDVVRTGDAFANP